MNNERQMVSSLAGTYTCTSRSIATDTTCHLLRLSRELRDMIYHYLTIDVDITQDGIESHRLFGIITKGKFVLSSTTTPSLLLLNHQIRDEYMQYTQPRSILSVDLVGCTLSALDSVELQANVSPTALGQVRAIDITIHWCMVMQNPDADKLVPFWAHMAEQKGDQRTVKWTPTKQLRRKLLEFINLLGAHVHANTRVTITVLLDGRVDLLDPTTWSTSSGKAEAVKMAQMFDMDILFELELGIRQDWPASGRLMVQGLLCTPLWCSMASNSDEFRASRRVWEVDDTQAVVRPLYEMSDEKAWWCLRRNGSEKNWRSHGARFQIWAY
ncbi:hypothetical protein LTR27_004869 [Elasticomyces elasticus]|nr:hypothetical protein LTR27_004869 [Elasticomyces elasticus]